MRSTTDLLAENPFFAGFSAADLELVAGCATDVGFGAGEYLFSEGDPADRFFIIRHGRVSLEVPSPYGGGLVVETIEDGEVLGWSWLVPPFRYFFDARAVLPTSAVALNGACVRGKCDADPRLGYALFTRVAEVMLERLQATRVRMLDLYGAPGADRVQ